MHTGWLSWRAGSQGRRKRLVWVAVDPTTLRDKSMDQAIVALHGSLFTRGVGISKVEQCFSQVFKSWQQWKLRTVIRDYSLEDVVPVFIVLASDFRTVIDAGGRSSMLLPRTRLSSFRTVFGVQPISTAFLLGVHTSLRRVWITTRSSYERCLPFLCSVVVECRWSIGPSHCEWWFGTIHSTKEKLYGLFNLHIQLDVKIGENVGGSTETNWWKY